MARADLCTRELGLALALTATRARREASHSTIVELARRIDFSSFEALLRAQGTLSLLGRRLLELTDDVRDDFAERVCDYERRARRRGVHQQMLTIRLTAALANAGIRALPLKGPLLGERIHGDLGTRVSADIDLLVADTDLAAAIDVLSTLGYRRAPRAQSLQRSIRPDLHECLRSVQVDLPEVELHWRIHWYEERFSAMMLQRAVTGPDGYLHPTAADELVGLLLFYARDGMAGLRLLTDLTGWWDRFGGTSTATETNAPAREHPALVPAIATAALVAKQLGGLPAELLFEQRILSRASSTAIRLSDWSQRGSKGQTAANVALIDCLLAPRERRCALATRQLWRSEFALGGEWSETALSRGTLMRMRIVHATRVVGRWAIALWRLRRGGEWEPVPGYLRAGGQE